METTEPPTKASYQTIEKPVGAVAVAVSTWSGDCWHWVWSPPLIGALGVWVVSVMVTLVAVVQPLLSVIVTVYIPADKLDAVDVVWIGLVFQE